MDIVWKGNTPKEKKNYHNLIFLYEFFMGGKILTQDSSKLKCATANLLFCSSQKPDSVLSPCPKKQIHYGALSHSALSGHLPYGLAV